MIEIDQLRSRQEQRLASALESWNEAKDQLKNAIALTVLREREFREVSDDVQRKLAALDLVVGMANEMGGAILPERRLSPPPGTRPMLMLMGKTHGESNAESGFAGLLRKSSRPLFPPRQQSKNPIFSILQ